MASWHVILPLAMAITISSATDYCDETKSENDLMRCTLSWLDTDGSGSLSSTEVSEELINVPSWLNFADLLDESQGARETKTQEAASAWVKWADQNDDEKVDVDEFKAAMRHSIAEMDPKEEAKVLVKYNDVNEDGIVNVKEMVDDGKNDIEHLKNPDKQSVEDSWADSAKNLDTDGDGVVTEDEIVTCLEKMQAEFAHSDDALAEKEQLGRSGKVQSALLGSFAMSQMMISAPELRKLQLHAFGLMRKVSTGTASPSHHHPSIALPGVMSTAVGGFAVLAFVGSAVLGRVACRRRAQRIVVHERLVDVEMD